MSHSSPALVGSVFERKPTSHAAPKAFTSTKTGFPAVQHRSRSAFARNREELRKAGPSRLRDTPTVAPSQSSRAPEPVDPDEWRNQMSHDNEQRVANMTEEERDRERQEIIERFGAGVEDLLKRMKLAREKQADTAQGAQMPTALQTTQDPTAASLDEVPITPRERFEQELASHETNRLSSPPPALSTSSTRPSSRADRKLRFAELAPEDVHVYESAPPSPRRKALALPPPPDDGSAISLGQFNGKLAPPEPSPTPDPDPEPVEGSAEYIRRRYFPDAPVNDPNLAWMQHSSELSNPGSVSSSLRFDLSGKPIPISVSLTLPTHLGLHHHAEGAHAGYTLDDIFLLSRSTVPAQRTTMLGVLAKVAQRISKMVHGEINGMEEVKGKEEELRNRIMAAGVEAMMERGSVGARAVEVIWQCVVGWDEDIMAFEGVELETSTDSAINSLRLDFFLLQIATLFVQGAISEETRLQLLSILHRLAQHNNEFASAIVTTPKLIATVVQTFLLTPIPPSERSPPPNSFALELLVVLASASRENAKALQTPADALLRFMTFLPSASMYPAPLATSLLRSMLRFYTALAKYGLYSHIATTATEVFTQLGRHILSDACTSSRLMVAWTDLLTAWIVCAVDPHQTTPSHEILWSQITGWGWNSEVLDLSDRLGVEEKDWPVWAGVWRVYAAWLEGARVNGVRGGSTERAESLELFRSGFVDGKEKDVVLGCLDAMQRDLGRLGFVPITHSQLPHLCLVAGHAATLAAAIRLWLACLPPLSDGPLISPPFPLPFPRISDLCAKITVHPAWSLLTSPHRTMRHACVYMRSLSELLSAYLRLSQRLPDISEELWAAQGLSILSKLLPGDEDFAAQVADELLGFVRPGWVDTLGIHNLPAIWERGGMAVIKPFLAHTIRPHRDTFIGPPSPTPRSISQATTQRLPSPIALPTYGLPITREWTLTPLDHLLRSGSSEVFKALPADWDASEIDIVRASLLLTKLCREVLQRFALTDFVLTRDEAVFGCMKVFMLEHGQTQTDSTEEVFHDRLVGQLMEILLQPYTVSATPAPPGTTPVVPPPAQENLEQVSTRFLGKTPFYQYYTDFVALYDAISFSHSLFSRLLLPPTSMRYPLDYRKYLWNDFGHIIKTIRTPVDQVICEDIREYLWPVENDTQMISSYLRALLKERLQGFVHLLALHHVACNVWPDLHNAGWGADRASKLLKVVVEQGEHDVVKDVVLYRQHKTGATLLPPRCLGDLGDEVKAARRECIVGWGLEDRLQGLLIDD